MVTVTQPHLLVCCVCVCVYVHECMFGGNGRVRLASTVTPPWLLLHCLSWIPKMGAIWLYWDLHAVLWESLERDRQAYEAHSWDVTQRAAWSGAGGGGGCLCFFRICLFFFFQASVLECQGRQSCHWDTVSSCCCEEITGSYPACILDCCSL